jgi:hypothetical protein
MTMLSLMGFIHMLIDIKLKKKNLFFNFFAISFNEEKLDHCCKLVNCYKNKLKFI